MKTFFLQFFTWWNGQTLGTRFFTWRKGTDVGTDQFGNTYYEGPDGQRWVIYAGEADPSTVPPGWHGWLHHRVDVAPSQEDYRPREWEKPHEPNMTGTAAAYRPRGSIAHAGRGTDARDAAPNGYEAWTP